jgi:hypothetical protein
VEVAILVPEHSDRPAHVILRRSCDRIRQARPFRIAQFAAEIFSSLDQVEVGIDPDGDEITSLVVVPTEESATPIRGLSGANQRALDCLFATLLDFGAVPPANSHIPNNTRTTTLVRWKELCEAKMIADSEKLDSKRKAFVRTSRKLQDLKIIGIWHDHVWVTGQAGQARTSILPAGLTTGQDTPL